MLLNVHKIFIIYLRKFNFLLDELFEKCYNMRGEFWRSINALAYCRG